MAKKQIPEEHLGDVIFILRLGIQECNNLVEKEVCQQLLKWCDEMEELNE